jgi:adenine phosphoribosyltransferase|tara:strand:+ start:4753 stop:5265 length:513 start_codon:yes stop_codon:yes gene_type:complete
MNFDQWIDSYPDFPKPGILFRDISPLLASPEGMSLAKKKLCEVVAAWDAEVVAGVDARGFLFSTLIADELGLGSLMIRKSGKLPGEVISKSYELEYGTNELSMQKLPDLQNKRVVVVDDLLATGGTIKCANDLIESQGAKVVGCAFVVELLFLKGSHLIDCETLSLQKYE